MGRKEVKKWPHFTEKEIVQKGGPRKASCCAAPGAFSQDQQSERPGMLV
jgi:hypothetical protein